MSTISILDYQEDDNLQKTKWGVFCGTPCINLLFRGFKVKSTYFVLRDTCFCHMKKTGVWGEGLRRPELFQNHKGPIGADKDEMEPEKPENLSK